MNMHKILHNSQTSTTTQLRAEISFTLQFSNRLIGCATDPPDTQAAQPRKSSEYQDQLGLELELRNQIIHQTTYKMNQISQMNQLTLLSRGVEVEMQFMIKNLLPSSASTSTSTQLRAEISITLQFSNYPPNHPVTRPQKY